MIWKCGFINGVDNVNWPLAFRISVRWPIYIINSVDKTKFLYTTSPPTQHHSFFRNYPLRYYDDSSGSDISSFIVWRNISQVNKTRIPSKNIFSFKAYPYSWYGWFRPHLQASDLTDMNVSVVFLYLLVGIMVEQCSRTYPIGGNWHQPCNKMLNICPFVFLPPGPSPKRLSATSPLGKKGFECNYCGKILHNQGWFL